MLKAVAGVRDEVLVRCAARGAAEKIDLETITQVFIGLTIIDYIIFVRYDTAPDNPICGEFVRWSRRPSVYSAAETIVEIRYAEHLSEAWRRFVVCKELCHALDTSHGTHAVSPSAVEGLVGSFAIRSTLGAIKEMPVNLQLELLAEAGAIELLCPFPIRQRIVSEIGMPSDEQFAQLAQQFNIPEVYARIAFNPIYTEAVITLFGE